MCKCACQAKIADMPLQLAACIMHFDTVAQEVVNEPRSLSRMFDHEVVAVSSLIHKKGEEGGGNGLEEIRGSASPSDGIRDSRQKGNHLQGK